MRSFRTYVNEKAGNGTVNLYKRDGQGGYTAKDHDCVKAHPGKSHKAWVKGEEEVVDAGDNIDTLPKGAVGGVRESEAGDAARIIRQRKKQLKDRLIKRKSGKTPDSQYDYELRKSEGKPVNVPKKTTTEEVDWNKMTQKEKEVHAEKDRKRTGGVPYPASAKVKPEGRPRVKGMTPGEVRSARSYYSHLAKNEEEVEMNINELSPELKKRYTEKAKAQQGKIQKAANQQVTSAHKAAAAHPGAKGSQTRAYIEYQANKNIGTLAKKYQKRERGIQQAAEEVSWDEAQYWSEDTVADFLKRGGKITQLKPRVARGATKKKTIRLKGVKSTDRGRKAEKKMHGEEVVDEGGIGSIYPKDKPLQSPTAIKVAKALSKKRAAIRNRKKVDETWGIPTGPGHRKVKIKSQRHPKGQEFSVGDTPGGDVVKPTKPLIKVKTKKKIGHTITDRTPKGYGPTEEVEVDEIWRTPRDKYVKGAGGRGLAAKTERDNKEANRKAVNSALVAKLIAAGERAKTTASRTHKKTTVYNPEEVEIKENVAYLKGPKGKTFVVSKRDPKGMAGKQDKFSMSVVDKKGKTVKDHGSHPSLKGAKKFASSRGYSEEVEYIDEAKMGEILKNVKKGTAPYTIVAHKTGRVVGQEHTKMAQAVPAFVREIQKKYPNAKVSVEDRRGRVLHSEEYIEESGMYVKGKGLIDPKGKYATKAPTQVERERKLPKGPAGSRSPVFKKAAKTYSANDKDVKALEALYKKRDNLLKKRGNTDRIDKHIGSVEVHFTNSMKESIDEGVIILPKRSSRGGDVKEVGKNKRGSKTEYYWKHKSGLKNVFDSIEKLRYSLRNDANFKDAEKITNQLERREEQSRRMRGEAVSVDGRMKGYKDAVTRIAARHKVASNKPAIVEPEEQPDVSVEPETDASVEEGLRDRTRRIGQGLKSKTITKPIQQAIQAFHAERGKQKAKTTPGVESREPKNPTQRKAWQQQHDKVKNLPGGYNESAQVDEGILAARAARSFSSAKPQTASGGHSASAEQAARLRNRENVARQREAAARKRQSGTNRPPSTVKTKIKRVLGIGEGTANVGDKNAPVTSQDMNYLSDFYKDVYGVRPRGTYKHVKTVGDYQKEIASLSKAAAEEQGRVKQDRIDRKKDKAVQKKRSFGPKGGAQKTTMKNAFQKALARKRQGARR